MAAGTRPDGPRSANVMTGSEGDSATIEGCAPGAVGLLIVDMINDLDFEDADRLLDPALKAAGAIADLRAQADAAGAPVIYVNDNYGQWHSERSRIIAHCREGAGAALLGRLEPRPNDYFVIKPQVSGFYATNLPVLLPKLGVSRLVLTGVAADICVLFTAADAHMRAYQLWVPSDAVASSNPQHCAWALQIMQKSLGAEVRPTSALSLGAWIAAEPQG